MYTVMCTGTTGQTAKLQGSIDNQNWIDIVDFTIDADAKPLSAVVQFTYKYLRTSGAATIKISRG